MFRFIIVIDGSILFFHKYYLYLLPKDETRLLYVKVTSFILY